MSGESAQNTHPSLLQPKVGAEASRHSRETGGLASQSSCIQHYHKHLHQTGQWLLASIAHGNGGSAAHFSPLLGWSKPYPETTGYIIPTLLKLSTFTGDESYRQAARACGQWLLSIQRGDGAWNGGLHPASTPTASAFNTGQILKGMCALYGATQEEKFLTAAQRGAQWLAAGVDETGLWPAGDYQAKETPSYYTHVAWPMLEVWTHTRDDTVRDAAERFLQRVLTRRCANGVFSGWGFKEGKPAFTHTIAYTLRGLQESARLLDDYATYSTPAELALETLLKKAELRGGRLPGEFDDQWNATGDYVCLTGNAQIAICLMLLDRNAPDLRLINAAAKLEDYVCQVQCMTLVPPGIKGAVAGSNPLWGHYMIFRYPNWAAKYHCDALLLLIERLSQEMQ